MAHESDNVEGQVHGAVIHGLAASLYENLQYDENGQLLASTFIDYLAPNPVDMPHVEVDHMITPSPFTDLGTKGVGEGGGAPLSTICGAVEDALAPFNIRLTDSHLSPENILASIKKHGNSQRLSKR